MRKLDTLTLDQAPTQPSRVRRVINLLFALCLGLLMAPLLSEGASLIVANWQSLYGRMGHVETPLLDAIRSLLTGTTTTVRMHANGLFRNLPWRPSLVITVGLAWALFMSVPLRQR